MLHVRAHRAGEDDGLQIAALADEIVDRVAMGDRGDVLGNDRPLVQLGRRVVRSGADELDTALLRLVVGLGADEGRQERVVDVD